MSLFQTAKVILVERTHLTQDALHIYVALTLFLGSCLAFGWKARDFKPLVLVASAALAGEALDLREATGPLDAGPIDESIKDLWNTMLVPTILLLLARYSRVFREPVYSGDQTEISDTPTGT